VHVLMAGQWEPDESRGSSPVLREAGGEIPPAYSPRFDRRADPLAHRAGRAHPHREAPVGPSPDDIEVHQVRALADLARAEPGSAWAAVMTRKRRKTLVVCLACHDSIHQNTPPPLTP
jgi:hypothetical protein